MRPGAELSARKPNGRALSLGLLLVMCMWPGVSHAWKFVVLGDTIRTDPANPINSEMVAELAVAISNEAPAFVLVAGDLIYWGGETAYRQWTNLMSPVYQAGIGVYPAVGNHDVQFIEAFGNVFGPTQPNNGPAGETGTYALNYSNALVLVANEYSPTNYHRVNQGWIDAVLATNTQRHVFAIGHEPAFKVMHTDCLDSYAAERDRFWLSLRSAGARVYFSGHDHFYDHCRVDDGDGDPDNDLHQVIVGTGGAPIYGDGAYNGTNNSWAPKRVYHEAQFGYVSVNVGKEGSCIRWHHRTGPNQFAATAEVFTYALTPRPRLQLTSVAETPTLSWSGPYRLESALEIAGPYAPVAGATSPYRLTDLDTANRFFRLALNDPEL